MNAIAYIAAGLKYKQLFYSNVSTDAYQSVDMAQVQLVKPVSPRTQHH